MSNRTADLAKIWLAKANDDFLWAKDTFSESARRFGNVCFLCQQATEKALKAFLLSQNQTLIRTHNLPLLNEKCKKFSKKFSAIDRAVDILNNYYTDTRYPDIWDYQRFDSEQLAKEALIFSKKVLDIINKII